MGPALLPRVSAGDRTAIRECIDRYGNLIWSLARRASAVDAEDAVQEIFLDLWRSAPRFDATMGSEVTFVAMIARRRLVDRRRARQRRPETESISDREGVESFGASAASLAPSSELGAEAALAARALDRLRPEQREVLLLTCHGLSHEEVAERTGMPLGTVKAHARRGLVRMREALAEVNPVAAAGGTR